MSTSVINYLDLATPQNNSFEFGVVFVSWIYANIGFSEIIYRLVQYDNKLEIYRLREKSKNVMIYRHFMNEMSAYIRRVCGLLRLYTKTMDHYNLKDDTFGPYILRGIDCRQVFVAFYMIENIRRKLKIMDRVDSLYTCSMKNILNYLIDENAQIKSADNYFSKLIRVQYEANIDYMSEIENSVIGVSKKILLNKNFISCSLLLENAHLIDNCGEITIKNSTYLRLVNLEESMHYILEYELEWRRFHRYIDMYRSGATFSGFHARLDGINCLSVQFNEQMSRNEKLKTIIENLNNLLYLRSVVPRKMVSIYECFKI